MILLCISSLGNKLIMKLKHTYTQFAGHTITILLTFPNVSICICFIWMSTASIIQVLTMLTSTAGVENFPGSKVFGDI